MSNQTFSYTASASIHYLSNKGNILAKEQPLVIIDPSIDEPEKLADGVRDGIPVHILDAHRDGIHQITNLLQEFPVPIQRLHIISHGNPGTLYLGNSELSLATLANYTQDLLTWFQDSETTPELLLYGCNVAAGDAGAEFLAKLHAITNAHLAASTHKVGHPTLGGTWHLNTRHGQPNLSLPFTTLTQSSYQGVFAEVDLDSGVTITAGDAGWFVNNFGGTSNGLPTGGSADGSSGLTVVDAELVSTSQGDAYDNGLVFFINNEVYAPDDTADLTGTTLTASTVELSGLNVTAQYYADPNTPVLRSFVTLENPTDEAITITFTVATNMGSDFGTVVVDSSSGDNTFGLDDAWVITSDDLTGPSDPVITHVRYGPGASVTTQAISLVVFDAASPDGVLAEYSVTIPALSTQSLLLFDELSPTPTDASTGAARYDSVETLESTTLLDGLTDEQLASIANWDFMLPTPFDDSLTGTAGRDVIFALAGNDRVRGLAGNDRLAGQEGNDRLIGGAGRDNLLGGSGQDTLLGGADDDRLLGGTDDDRLNGNGGNDRLVGGAGSDTLRGDAGADTLVGGVANDTLLGGSGNDRLLGSAGDDALNGQSGNDIVRGGSGNDVLRGGIGNDRLIGNQGNDLIFGGPGRDRIVVRSGPGLDRFADFQDGLDRIVLPGISFDALSIQQQGDDVLISSASEGLLLLSNTNVEQISQADFV